MTPKRTSLLTCSTAREGAGLSSIWGLQCVFLGEKTKMKMSGLIENSMSIGGRLVKIDACLSSTVVYQMFLRLLHKTNIEQMDKPIRSFF
jgi:hypothetical protein